GRAAGVGARTLVLEKKDRTGRKLNITGKGRCNLTNAALMESFLERFGSGARFLRPAFNHMNDKHLGALMEGLGVPTVVERGSRVFPASQKAGDVVAAMRDFARKSGARIETEAPVRRIRVEGGMVSGVELQSGEIRSAKAVILATGGASYPATGSTGDGYAMAEGLGHSINPVHPALVPLETGGAAPKLQGLSLYNAGVSVFIDGKKKRRAFGELLFTHFGVSGPVILTLSGEIVAARLQGREVELRLDLKPALEETKLENRLLRDLDQRGGQRMGNLLRGLLPRKLVGVCLEQTGIPEERTGNQVSARERKALRTWFKDFRLPVTGYRSFHEAIVTAGGVNLKEVDPKSMGSRLVDGLYFAGEVLDIAADTGGYNLQAAFSTGSLAGTCAAQYALARRSETAAQTS
ncbi:MAG: NAD(P)/FAD-dependent oxidoreductase, partial [Desulfohalobiaceae bacterium]|nr:NAD(P)/FAD-dependent oxidoreductase [Desulfohalobiaceae bacterium]